METANNHTSLVRTHLVYSVRLEAHAWSGDEISEHTQGKGNVSEGDRVYINAGLYKKTRGELKRASLRGTLILSNG